MNMQAPVRIDMQPLTGPYHRCRRFFLYDGGSPQHVPTAKPLALEDCGSQHSCGIEIHQPLGAVDRGDSDFPRCQRTQVRFLDEGVSDKMEIYDLDGGGEPEGIFPCMSFVEAPQYSL